MLKTRTLLALVICLLVISLCPVLYGQATGSFSGTVSDKTGSVVSGANVKVTSQGTGVVREAKTDGTGHYLIPVLPVSIYTIRVEFQGFQPAEQKDVRLQVDERRVLDFTLSPASVTSTVEVSATEVTVQTTDPTLGQVITSEQVADLPLNGRDFVQLATLTPGTTQETNPGSFFNGGPSSEVSTRGSYSLSVGGSRAQSTDWLLDGNDNNELTAGGISILPSIDAIQEFKVLTYNYSAEYGTRAGPTVLVTTKSGSNKLHGSLFEFFRNTKLDSRSYFAATKEKFNLNQFGGALGGALQKDKTFFFLDYEAKMQRLGVPNVGFVPTADMMTGDFSSDLYGNPVAGKTLNNPFSSGSKFHCDASGNPLPADGTGHQAAGTDCAKIPASMFDPVGAQMIALYPAANANFQADPATTSFNYANVPVRKLNEGKFDVRLDHNFSGKDSLFARFSYDQAVSFVPGGSPGFAEPSAFASSQNITNHGRNIAISETHIFSDRNVNQFTAGFNRIFNHIKSFGDRSCESAKLGFLGANLDASCTNAPPGLSQSTSDCVSCGLVSTLMGGGYWALGDRGFAPFQGGTNVFSISDSFDMIRGSHNIRVGGGIRIHQMNVMTNAFQDGFLINLGFNSGDAAADLLLGTPLGGLHDQTFKGATTGRRWKMFRPFIQDDWRVTKDLTLNLGLAWAIVTPITESQNRQADFNFATGQFLVAGPAISGCNLCVQTDGRVGIKLDKTAFEPRIGLAWKPRGSNRTAVRAGFAIFHDSAWNQGAQGLWENPPYFAEIGNFNPCTAVGTCLTQIFNPPLTSSPNPAFFTGTVQSQNLDFKQGRVLQFNFNVEHQLPGEVVLTAGYAGARSTHILVDGLNLNVGSPTACGTVAGYTLGCGPGGTAFAPKWGAPTFFFPLTIANINDAGRARYDSLQMKAETKSARHGLYALLSYTYARNFDTGFADGLGTNPGATYWPLPGTNKVDWGLSQIQLNHNFSSSVIYDLPFGKGRRFGSTWNGAVNAVLGDWQATVIEKITSGFPIFTVASFNQSGVNFQWNGSSFNRPDQACSGHISHPTVAKWFDTSCFVHADPGKLGNANRSPLYGPGFINTDFSLVKHFRLPWESSQLDFRAEFFNLFNHAQFFMPNADVDAGVNSFGKINQTVNNPRLIQFALKLHF